MQFRRRGFVSSSLAACGIALSPWKVSAQNRSSRDLQVSAFELIPVRATERTAWLFVRLRTRGGLSGIGEASDAFGYANTSKADAQRMEQTLARFYALLEGNSVLDIESFRQRAWAMAETEGLLTVTAFCALEQALCDLAGQALGVPSYQLWGGKVRERLAVYANINRATRQRTPAGFADSARRALAEGYRAFKAAPFDGYPRKGSDAEIRRHVENGIACVMAIREAVGDSADVMIDCHSFFEVPAAIELAKRLEPAKLAWYEEPLPPERVEETRQIKQAISQPMAGGETLFAVKGFAGLCHQQAVDVIMPDAKFCGGLLEMAHIAAMAYAYGVEVAPHNPSGPVCTMATVQSCAGMRNFRTLEMQWGEVPWRGELLSPPEAFTAGEIGVPAGPGFGVRLRDSVASAHPL
ncbi:MAG: mandelate racemase/muconate lactonizing enzyme family protein [Bryobacterales bacterium]|nr:mandelate racemase/muconate lactonizing enzyme family protein [Bryobacterales bacterium]